MSNFDLEEKIIEKIILPYKILWKILVFLLTLSIIGNIYLSMKKIDITLIANDNKESTIEQTNG